MKSKGFTLLELLIVIALLGILAAIALPEFLAWSRSARYRDAASHILAALTASREQAINTNREHRVWFDVANNRYRIERGSLYANSVWPGAVDVVGWSGWVPLPSGVTLRSTKDCNVTTNFGLQFNPNGTSNAGYVCVMEPSTGIAKYKVAILNSSTGRAKIQK